MYIYDKYVFMVHPLTTGLENSEAVHDFCPSRSTDKMLRRQLGLVSQSIKPLCLYGFSSLSV